MAGRFLGAFKPLSRFMPEVSPPEREVRFNEKLFWTAMGLALFLIMSEVPLYGIEAGGGMELTYLRVIFASARGTLMELGIGPIVTAGLILQLLAGSGMVSFDRSDPEDRALFTSASKVLSLVMIGVQASAYLIGGVYGTLDPRISVVVFLQLMAAGMVLMLLDEMIQKGWGIGSGISLFILAGVAQRIVWDSVLPYPVGDGKPYGALLAVIQTILNGEPLLNALIRPGDLPSLLGLIATIAVFLFVIYAEGVRVELPVAYARYRGFRGRYPIKLLYVSNIPVIFASALFANVYLVSQVLWSRLGQPPPGTDFWLDIIGQYRFNPESRRSELVGGLAFFVTSPRSFSGVMDNPLRAFVFLIIMVTFCVAFSLTWLEVGGLDPRTVARQLVDAGLHIPGFRRSHKPIEMILKRYIPVVTVLGGLIVGLLASLADFFGAFGTGMGILLSVGILYQYYQLLMQERVAEMYPAVRRLLE